MIEIGISKLTKRYGQYPVFSDVTFSINTGEKLGIVGSNGTGKTTIFRIINGDEIADEGEVSIRKGSQTGYLKQNPDEADGQSVRSVIMSAYSSLLEKSDKIHEIEKKMAVSSGSVLTQLTEDYGRITSDFEHKGGYDIEVSFKKICSGLEISRQMQDREFSSLSGGEKTRVMLAKILLEDPEILLLDEPTNHLDISSSEWLESYLSSFQGAVLIISHDRYFLDKVVSGIIEVENGHITQYSGNYSEFVIEKEKRLLAEFEAYKNIQKKIKAMKAAAERYRIWGRINPDNSAHFARAKKLEAKIEELQQIEKPLEKFKIKMSFSGTSRSGNDVVAISNLYKRYGDNLLFKNAKFLLRHRERLALIGANGCGKSTLFRLITSDENPDNGQVKLGSSIKLGVMEQEVKFSCMEDSILDLFLKEFPMYEAEARNILARFLFRGDDIHQKAWSLSGGEKVRLRICMLMQQDLNFLMLDEPTNHLDIESKEMIEEALQDFDGTILFISHDRYFINKIASSIAAVENHNIKRYSGDYDYYRSHCSKDIEEQPVKVKENKAVKGKKVNPQILQKLEDKIFDKEEMIKEIDMDLEKYSTDYQKLIDLQNERSKLEEELEVLITEWENVLDNK